MSESFTRLNGNGKLTNAIRELQNATNRSRATGGPGVLVDSTTRGKIVKAQKRANDVATPATTTTVIPRWG